MAEQESILEHVRPVQQLPQDNESSKTLLIVVAIILLIIAIMYFSSPKQSNGLSHKLQKKGWTLYLMKGCGYCHKQMKLLGDFKATVVCSNGKMIDKYTSNPPLACSSIQGFPLWYNTKTDEKITGFQDMAALNAML